MERKSPKEYSIVFFGGRRKVEVTKILPSRSSSLFSSRQRACPVLKHNRVSEVFKGLFKVHDFVHYSQRNYVLKWEFKEARNSFYGLGVYLLKSKFRIEGKLRFP